MHNEGLAKQTFAILSEFYEKYEIENDNKDHTINSLAQIGISHPFKHEIKNDYYMHNFKPGHLYYTLSRIENKQSPKCIFIPS